MQVLQKLLEGSFTFRRAIKKEQQPLCKCGLIHHSAIVLRLRERVHGAVQGSQCACIDGLSDKRLGLDLRSNRK
jgi:hypothetical protein